MCLRQFLTHSSPMVLHGRTLVAMESNSIARKYLWFLQYIRKLNTILASCVIAIAFAAMVTFIQTALSLLTYQSKAAQYLKLNSRHFQTTPAYYPPNITAQRHGMDNLVLVFDFWERMINVQSGLRRLVSLGIDSDFTVVEPFVYESKVSPHFSLPEHFLARNMKPQPASLYFRTRDLITTNRFITFEQWKRKAGYNDSRIFIDAALFINWNRSSKIPDGKFQKCDSMLSNFPRSIYGRQLSEETHILSVICVEPPQLTTPTFFKSLFSHLRERKNNITRCKTCTATVALMNYRKHAFSPFISNTGADPFLQKVPPLYVSDAAVKLAGIIRGQARRSRKKKFIAIHLRTGKAFVLFSKKMKELNIDSYEEYGNWLERCTDNIIRVAKSFKNAAYYIASDMYHDGWKGGEIAPVSVQRYLDEARSKIDRELGTAYKFSAKQLDINQDVMGMSGAVDAAVGVDADVFVHAVPSNFGTWVSEQRLYSGKEKGLAVSCWDERLKER